MSSKLIPSKPDDVMVIRDITPNVVTFSVPFLRHGQFPIGGRGTAVRLTSGGLAIFSPVALTPSAQAKITSLGGDVRYLIATDFEHHIFLSEWATAYPNAKLVGPEGLPEKRAKVHNDPKIGHEPFAVVITRDQSSSAPEATRKPIHIGEDFDADFEVEYLPTHPNKELVFFYRPDRVLVQADLMFNLPAVEQYSRVPEAEKPRMGVLQRFFNSFQNTEGEALGMKRFLWHVVSRGDREGFEKSVKRIAGWDFETVVPCHGETIVGGGKGVFEKVFSWHLVGKGVSK
ncbi:beta-lactamase-like protein [Chaetomium sp. MPI-SDFR-AT-0129]|nr:beta-lactamase-like protein [Chaetomium sp. MPI-SDFR-AT-0129]